MTKTCFLSKGLFMKLSVYLSPREPLTNFENILMCLELISILFYHRTVRQPHRRRRTLLRCSTRAKSQQIGPVLLLESTYECTAMEIFTNIDGPDITFILLLHTVTSTITDEVQMS